MSAEEQVVEEDSLDGVERELLRGEGARLGSDEASVSRDAARLVVDRFRAHERQRKVMWSAGGALSLAAAAALVVGLSRHTTEEKPAARVTPPAAASPLVVESGSVQLGGNLVVRGEPVAANTPVGLAPKTCLRAGRSVRLCSPEGAQLRLPALGSAWDVELMAGAVTVDLEAMPAGFSIRTLHGSASVVGTLFRVELDSALHFTTVSVEHGRVRVKHRAGEEAALAAGERAVLGDRLELSGGSHEPLPVPSSGVAPADQAPAPGASKHEASGAPGSEPKGKTASDLLEEARQQRASRHYAQAAQLYRKLVQQHPESAEARAALVSLGQLELGQLGQPEAALRSFRQYLAHPGQLRQEAEHGVIQALQRLGRKAEERRAIEAFLARYPKSTQAGPLAERLKQL
jgi:TolA-binding protein